MVAASMWEVRDELSCANRMSIHVSTLRYRLERLHELFGIELENPDSVFGLTLALRLRELETDAPVRRSLED